MVWTRIKNLFSAKEDPVKTCNVYVEIGCSHVDGFLCDMASCSIRKAYNELPKKERDAYDQDWKASQPSNQ